MTTEVTTLKIVLHIRAGTATIGVEAEGCDAVFHTVPTGELAQVLEHVAPAVAQAREIWQERRQGPAYQAPPPPPTPPRAQQAAPAASTPRGRPAQAKPAPAPAAPAQPTQQRMV